MQLIDFIFVFFRFKINAGEDWNNAYLLTIHLDEVLSSRFPDIRSMFSVQVEATDSHVKEVSWFFLFFSVPKSTGSVFTSDFAITLRKIHFFDKFPNLKQEIHIWLLNKLVINSLRSALFPHQINSNSFPDSECHNRHHHPLHGASFGTWCDPWTRFNEIQWNIPFPSSSQMGHLDFGNASVSGCI